jgi:hypothetical protein
MVEQVLDHFDKSQYGLRYVCTNHLSQLLNCLLISDLLGFSNTWTPSPPWTHVVRTQVSLSKCEEAAPYLIKALGGEDVAKRLIGGVKWCKFVESTGQLLLYMI